MIQALILVCGNYRNQITKDDIKVYAAVLEKPGDSFPNASKWYAAVSSQLAPRFVFFFVSASIIINSRLLMFASLWN